MRRWRNILAAFWVTLAGAAAAQGLAGVEVAGTQLTVRRADGAAIEGSALIGARLAMRDEAGGNLTVRIESVAHDAMDRTGEVMLYGLSAADGHGGWLPACNPNAEGSTAAILQPGGEGTIAVWCVSGALAKCIRFGYHPWRSLADGTPLARYHRACVNLVRADYCGDNQPTTRDGMAIDVYDRVGVQQPDFSVKGLGFEAVWGEAGALCVARPRVPQNISLERLVQQCPRLKDRVGGVCTEQEAERFGTPLLFNRSTGKGIPGELD
jgi:hypothetical protein